MRSIQQVVAIVGFCLLAVQSSLGQTFTPDAADRVAAVSEGNLTWYSSTPFPLVQTLAVRFQQETGIKVELMRLGGEAVLRRFMQEYEAGLRGADVVTMSNAGAAVGMTRKGMLAPFRPAGFDKVVKGAADPQGHWIAQRVDLIGIPIRTDKVAEPDRPKTWSDLANPKFKHMMIMPDPSFTALQLMVVGTLSQKLGWKFYEDLRQNDTMIVQGHQQVYNMMQQGERVIGAEGVEPRSYNDGKEVSNQTMIYPTEGSFLVASPTAIAKNAPHPNAAKLFAEFMLSPKAQQIIVDGAIYSSRVDLPPPEAQPALRDLAVMSVDTDDIESNGRRLKARFSEIFQ